MGKNKKNKAVKVQMPTVVIEEDKPVHPQGKKIKTKNIAKVEKPTIFEESEDSEDVDLDGLVDKNEDDSDAEVDSDDLDGLFEDGEEDDDDEVEDGSEDEGEIDEVDPNVALSKHEAELKKIIADDPEFAEFLEAEDTDLLNFGVPDDEELDGKERVVVTQEMIDAACKVFDDKKADKGEIKKCVTFTVRAFIACLKRVTPNAPESSYIVKSDDVFDRVIRMAFTYLSSAFLALLEPVENKVKAEKEEIENEVKDEVDEETGTAVKQDGKPIFKYWKKYYTIAKQFCAALNLFLMEITSDNILNACLRTILDNSSIFVQINKVCNHLIKNLVRIWSRRAHESRCLAFVILCKLVRFDTEVFPSVFKSCYVAYVANTKVVSVASLPVIAFMQKSFSELTYLNPNVAYQYAFVYIRQCAIHLRNATIAKRKDLLKNVYNWQYVNCLYLWSQVMSMVNSRRVLTQEGSRWFRELLHPLVQVIMGVMKAFNVPRFVPLRLHCVKMLLKIQMTCGIYIPTMALAADLLSDLKQIETKKPKKAKGSARIADMKELIKFNVEMLEDGTYRDRLATEIRTVIIEAAYVNRGSVAFADMFVPIQQQFRKFLKEYKNPNILPLMKETFTCIKEHADKVRLQLNRRGIDLKNMKDVAVFAEQMEKNSSDLLKMRDLLKHRIASHIVPKEKVSKKSLDQEISELFEKQPAVGNRVKLGKNENTNRPNKKVKIAPKKGKKGGVQNKTQFKKMIKNQKKK